MKLRRAPLLIRCLGLVKEGFREHAGASTGQAAAGKED